MRELLIRYLLGELSEPEREEVQRRLDADPTLRRELAYLRSCLAAARESDPSTPEPPRGLAERTTVRVACGPNEPFDAPSRRAAALAAVAEPPVGVLGWSLADLTVAGGVVLAVSMLLFPALGDSRNATRRTVCQNNQRRIYIAAFEYAQDHGRYFPKIESNENAGMFAVRLADAGYISRDELAVILVCPGAPLADEIRCGKFVMRVPSKIELQAMSPAQLAQAKRNMSPFYAYRFPYRIGQQYYYVRAERVRLSPLFSDTPGTEEDGLMSPNHGGSIVQVMCRDGSVKSLTTRTVPGINDDLFRNALGLVAAGCDRQDSVLARSEAMPASEAVK